MVLLRGYDFMKLRISFLSLFAGLTTEKKPPRAQSLANTSVSGTNGTSYTSIQTTAALLNSSTELSHVTTSAGSTEVLQEVSTVEVARTDPDSTTTTRKFVDLVTVDIDSMVAEIALEPPKRPQSNVQKAYGGLDMGGIIAGFLSGINTKPSKPNNKLAKKMH